MGAETQSTHDERRFRGRIGVTLTLFLVVLAIVPNTLLTVLVTRVANEQARAQAENQLESIVEFRSQEIQRMLESGWDVLNRVVEDTLQHARITTTVEARDRRLAPAEQVDEYLTEMLEDQNVFTELVLYTLDGEVRSATNAGLIGQSVAGAPYFLASLDGNTVHPIYYDEATGELYLMSTRVVTAVSGETVGVLAGRHDLNVLYDLLSSYVGLGSTGETYLVNQDRLLVSPSRFEDTVLAAAYESEGINRALAGQSGAASYEGYRQVPVIGAYRWLPTLQAALLAEIDQAEALQVGYQIERLSLLAAFILVVVSMSLGLGLTLWITRPLQALTKTATLVASGDYSQRTDVARTNEIGQLAYAFNKMTDQLVQTIGELDKHIEDLKEAKARVEEASRLKDDFLAVMSHELRTPLNASIGLLGLLEMDGKLDEEGIYMVRRARANNNRLLDLINNILDITRIEAGRMQLVPSEVDLRGMVTRLAQDMEILAEQKGLEFNVQIDDDVPQTLHTDPDALLKISTNLLSNAFKFTAHGSVTWQIMRQNGHIVMKVKDTGIGIPAHMHETIFERFRQVDSSSKRVHGGSGLGLSIVQRLCQAMKGSVHVESALGEGSTFIVTIPLSGS